MLNESIYTTYCNIFFYFFHFFFCLAIFTFEYVKLQLLKQEKDIIHFDELKDAMYFELIFSVIHVQ